jgi:peptidoglycan/xylan/chitin deacetylase (PgdA/CDA1 family)
LDFRIAELLAKYGLPGTFYVPRASQRPVMNDSQVRALSHTFEIGAHTLDHVTMERSTDEKARGQLSGSRQWVEEITGKCCEVFCFPGGKFKARQLRLVREAGFRAVRTVELLSIAEPRLIDGLQIISTTIQAFPHPRFAYLKNAAKRLPYSGFVPLTAAMYGGDWVALAKDLLARTIERGGVFHLWGHSWEIEEQNQWRQLEEVLALLGSCKTNVKSVTNGELRARAT